jgi:hypothetical protein
MRFQVWSVSEVAEARRVWLEQQAALGPAGADGGAGARGGRGKRWASLGSNTVDGKRNQPKVVSSQCTAILLVYG